ncbi:hypothetical protein CUMW_028220 [Citrus unshiu]|nr:hypothetical protein CUMW_028220 [Citrus unshiu]
MRPIVSDTAEDASYIVTVPIEFRDAFISTVGKRQHYNDKQKYAGLSRSPTPGALLAGKMRSNMRILYWWWNDRWLSLTIVYLESFYVLRKVNVKFNHLVSSITARTGGIYNKHSGKFCLPVFSASSDEAREMMRQASVDYLGRGGIYTSGAMALLSGLNPRPSSLIFHFLAMAVFGVGRLLLPFPSPKRLWIGAKLIWGASEILFPIIKAEGVRQMFFPATVPALYRAPPVY